jgi:hypothetical protein
MHVITRGRAALAASAVLGASIVGLATSQTANAQSRDAAPMTTRTVHAGQTTRLSGSGPEIAPAVGPEAESERTPVANRSLSPHAKPSSDGSGLSGISAADTAIQSGSAAKSFAGINHYQQRFGVDSGNQWSLEPPDQALCVGNNFVVEAVNNAVAVYDTNGNLKVMDSLNHFFGYPAEIDRSTGLAGPKQTTDPTCLYDPSTGRFFLTILTYDSDTAGNPLPAGTNTLDTAVSTSGNPTKTWTISHIDATDDGAGNTPDHTDCPCLGDYPHVGVDATGFYITTNEYPWATDGFNGAQIYAMSKAQLASGAESLTVTQIDTGRAAPGGQPGFTVWPAQSPRTTDYSSVAGGTEYFLSTNAAEEANGTGSSSTLLTWSLTNTSSLASSPHLNLHVVGSTVGTYAVPLAAVQKSGPVPLADCLNLTACAKSVSGTPDKFKETERPLDSLDSRMQQVTFAAGKLYGAHGTAVDVGTSSSTTAQRTGVAWYITSPTTAGNGNLSTTVSKQGRIASAGNNLLMPTLGVRFNGSAVIGVTVAGVDHFPSAAYVDLSSAGATGPVKIIAAGAGPEDGFAGCRLFGARPRWGDYGAAAVDSSGGLWVANEYIAQSCTFAQYSTATDASPFGTCNKTRTALANWATQIAKIS